MANPDVHASSNSPRGQDPSRAPARPQEPAPPGPPAPGSGSDGDLPPAGPITKRTQLKHRQGREDTTEALSRISESVSLRFEADQQICSFGEFLQDVHRDPYLYTRNAAEYVRDMFDYFGKREVTDLCGVPATRYNLFDAPFANGKGACHGQEAVQEALYHHLTAFCEKGRSDKLLMLHGPNGSSKTTIIELIMAGLEHYSLQAEGIVYRFNWIFSESFERDQLGFSRGDERPDLKGSYAYLPPEDISFQMPCELKDNPLFLVPRAERTRLVSEAYAALGQEPRLSHYLRDGDLCQKCKEICTSLLNAYQGDWSRMISHVQVERINISKRYRQGAVTIEPQRNVDADARALNLEKSFQIPPLLAHSNLIEPVGDLIDANGGVVEYSDFFKRPLEMHKYLLTTCEKNSISLNSFVAYLNMVMLASSNEKHLSAFKRDPDFPAFKGRIELIRVPYLLSVSKEQRIYEDHIATTVYEKHVAPHTARVAALWAVLTRLRRAKTKNFPNDIGSILSKLSPVQKATIYESGELPDNLASDTRRDLLSHLNALVREFQDSDQEFEGFVDSAYEGRRGASPREMMTLINQAAAFRDSQCLSPIAMLRAMRNLSRSTTLYDFLRLESDNGYHDIDKLTDAVEEAYLSWIVEEVQDSLDLVEEREYQRVFEDYFHHVKAHNRGERVLNRNTGASEEPNLGLMKQVESVIDFPGKPEEFRRSLIERIAVWAITNTGATLDYRSLFKDIYKSLRTNYYKQRQQTVEQITQNILKFGTDEIRDLSKEERKIVLRALARLKVKYSYCLHCAKEALSLVLKNRKTADN